MAINRYQTVLFSKRQELFIKCTEPGTLTSDLQIAAEGLTESLSKIDFALFKNRLLNIGEYLLHVSYQRIHQIERTIEGLYNGLTGRLSPKLIDPATLETVIHYLEKRTGEQ